MNDMKAVCYAYENTGIPTQELAERLDVEPHDLTTMAEGLGLEKGTNTNRSSRFKRDIVKLCEGTTQLKIANLFGIAPTTVSLWSRQVKKNGGHWPETDRPRGEGESWEEYVLRLYDNHHITINGLLDEEHVRDGDPPKEERELMAMRYFTGGELKGGQQRDRESSTMEVQSLPASFYRVGPYSGQP